MAPKKNRLNAGDRYVLNFLYSLLSHRAERNWDEIRENIDFIKALVEARKALNIPSDLSPSTDAYAHWVTVDEAGDVDLEESRWVESQNSNVKKRINSIVKALIEDFELTIDFDDHIRYWLLYQESPKWVSPIGIEHAIHAIENPDEMTRVPLTVIEKNMVKTALRKRFGISRGRPPKNVQREYHRLLNILNKVPINKTRRSRTHKETLAAIKLRNSTLPKTYGEMIDVLYPTLLDDIAEGKISNKEPRKLETRFRTRVSRHKKRPTYGKVKK